MTPPEREPERTQSIKRSALIGVILDPDCPPGQITAHPTWNRWAAFTNDELSDLSCCLNDGDDWEIAPIAKRYLAEITAELERRQP